MSALSATGIETCLNANFWHGTSDVFLIVNDANAQKQLTGGVPLSAHKAAFGSRPVNKDKNTKP